ncbi:S8 family peptidase [Pseudochryseolinea flava]|uniref:Peptidase S8 n=1 Tax=Pseudochryseolinea flava TaxID=2059302 RepID=A0A364XV15_9BACT|nr:S8 family peptidase [Pseudochryseolinea flava]RAV98008.1 peptidase S8 [Pseudochryseolinea flava]
MAVIKRILLLMLVVGASTQAHTQVGRYMVFFKEKNGTPYSISEPQEFLSQRAIDRRSKQGIAVTEKDLPVNPAYVESVKSIGVDVFFTTRWMNGLLIQCDQTLVDDVAALSFVDRVDFVAPNARLLGNGRKKVPIKQKTSRVANVTSTQLEQLNIDDMHQEGLHGEGIVIGIFDAGFGGVDVIDPFAAVIAEGRIDLEASKDFIINSDNVFQYDPHGTEVFSVIAAYQSGSFTGGAYKAKYQLYVTEDAATEYRIEEYNWLFAAERADSAGVDVVNSSLGYSTFDNNAMDYPKSALDGKTAVVTRAAQWLADRGVLIVCSAGNEGNNGWQLITPPADAIDVLSVASVDAKGARAASSSKGPSADNRIKPDVAALGVGTSVIFPNGSIGAANGTSLASPLIASFAAGVWQKYPDLTNKEIMTLIRQSGSLAHAPNNLLGHGIPDFTKIESYLISLEKNPFSVFPNPFLDSITIKPFSPGMVASCVATLITAEGKKVFETTLSFTREEPSITAKLPGLAAGVYMLKLQWKNGSQTMKLAKQ